MKHFCQHAFNRDLGQLATFATMLVLHYVSSTTLDLADSVSLAYLLMWGCHYLLIVLR